MLLDSLKIDKAMIVGHSMGGMLGGRFATFTRRRPERLGLYNLIGLSDGRFDGRSATLMPGYAGSLDQSYQ